jgi:MSHA pilin protein MshD
MSIRDARGLTLVELVVAIAIIGTAIGGTLLVLDVAVRGSASPMVEKQALAIAEAVLEEVQLMPFTYCDPDDAAADSALAPSGCSVQQGIGPQPGETRTSTVTPFDNVGDYQGYDSDAEIPPGIRDIAGTPISALAGYRVQVTVAPQAIPAVGASPAIPAAASLRVTVTVTGPAHSGVTIDAYRVRYAPNALP